MSFTSVLWLVSRENLYLDEDLSRIWTHEDVFALLRSIRSTDFQKLVLWSSGRVSTYSMYLSLVWAKVECDLYFHVSLAHVQSS